MPADETRAGESLRSPFLLIVGGIMLIGLALRLPSLDDSLLADELSTYFIVTGDHGPRNVLDYVRTAQEFTPPLFFWAAWLTSEVGQSFEALRMPSLLAGIGAIPLTYLIGALTVGRLAALVGAGLVALSPFLISFSTEARAYSLELFFVLCSTYGLLRGSDGAGVRWWVLYAAASCAAMYTHYTAAFVLVAQIAWALLARPGARRALILANLAAALAFLPWYPGYRDDSTAPGLNILDVLRPFTWDNVTTDLGRWLISNGGIPIRHLPGWAGIWLVAGGLALGLAGFLATIRERRRPSSQTVLILLLALAAPLGAVIYSSISFSTFTPRNLIGSWPFLALAVGALVTSSATRWAQLAATGLVIAGFSIGALKMTSADYQRSDYMAAAEFIEESSASGAPVVEVPGPSPGPQTPLEAALAPYGEMVPDDKTVLNLIVGSLRERLRARGPGGGGLFDPVPLEPLPPDVVARRAEKLAARSGGKLFLVTWGSTPPAAIENRLVGDELARFLDALSPRFRLVDSRSYSGYFGVSVNVFRDSGDPSRG